MTSIASAQSRPPPPPPPPLSQQPPLNSRPGLNRSQSSSGPSFLKLAVEEGYQGVQAADIDLLQDRPIKRRKTSSGSLAILGDSTQPHSTRSLDRYHIAPWSTVVRVNAENRTERETETNLPPLPERPWATTALKKTSLQDARPAVRVRRDVAVPNTPDCIESPSAAPLFEHSRRADYFPWTGKHPEDVVSEVHVKQGYFDRPPNPPEKELNTAKPPLYNAFKHRSGLDSLSALFSLVLDAKSKHGTFSSTSSFKGPPPRVTLTEAKRKSWISDLANPDVPLRKLSKTIPQGIRGLSLLDQCLQNDIPLGRAIWFTKCVGANEIRTLKRKGVNSAIAQGAELKWLREWTTNIEQFIESVLALCGQDKWKEKIRYSVLLAARLYLENLLDRDHYLEWILKSFSAASANHWPFWLMMVHLHRLDIIAFRKKGKQLAEILVLKYNSSQFAPGEALQPLAQNFAAAIRPLIITRPNCFLMPDKWLECQKAVSSCLDTDTESDRQSLEYLNFVNERALGGAKQGGLASASALEQVVEILDSFRLPAPLSTLYDALCRACPDQEMLVQKCLEWCVSKYRTGITRIYLAARLVRNFRKHGFDVDRVLLDFVFDRSRTADVDSTAMKHFVSELSRSNTFPCGKYMQGLLVRGLPHSVSVSTYTFPFSIAETNTEQETCHFQTCQGDEQLLAELCLLRTEDHLANLRNSLLQRAGWDDSVETVAFEHLRHMISRALSESRDTNNTQPWNTIQFSQLPWITKTRLAYWLRAEVVSLTKTNQMDIVSGSSLPEIRGLTLRRLQIVRAILEGTGDIAILADVLRVASSSRQEDVLATAVDTINMNCSTLHAIGALEPLQVLYGQIYVTLRSVKAAMPLYATSLINLCLQYPIKVAPVGALQQDLIRGDRGRAVTACSPFSDGVAESLQQAGATFHDDFEAILQTESNMNDQTMIRLFKVLVERIEKFQHAPDSARELFTTSQLLARLKLCQRSQGELLIKKWVTRLCSGRMQPMSAQLLFCLVCTRCVRLEIILEACQQLPATSATRLSLYAHIRHALLDSPDNSVDGALFYGFKLAVSKLAAVRPVELLDIIGTDESGRSSASTQKPALIVAILSNNELMKTLSKPAWLVVSQTLTEKLNQINPSDPPEVQARTLATSVGPLSLPYCSLRMRMLCQNAATKSDESIQDDIATMLCATLADPHSALSTYPRTFQTLLRATGPALGAKVRASVEQSFFNALPKFLQSRSLSVPPPPTQEEISLAAKALEQVILVSADGAGSVPPSGTTGLIEKLTIYMKILGAPTINTQQTSASSPALASVSSPAPPGENQLHAFLISSLDHLTFLLRMLCLKRSAFNPALSQPSPTAAKALQQDQVKLIGLLITIGTHPVWTSILSSSGHRDHHSSIRETVDLAFDVAATLVDDMSDESRTFCARILKDKLKDERVRWLLGSINSFGSVQSHDAGHGYQVVHESKGVLGEWKPKTWEMLESSGSGDSCLGLGLFGARKA